MRNDRVSLKRIWIVAGFMLFIAGMLVVRLYFVQIVHGDEYTDRADHQYVRPNQQLYDRGSIFLTDKDGRLVSGATLRTGYIIALHPNRLENAASLHDALNSLIPIEKDVFLARAAKKDDPYEQVAERVDKETVERIEKLDDPGIGIFKQRWRFYPGGSLASQALGFVAYEGDDLKGVYGLERYYDDVLQRDDDGMHVNFFAELFANLNKTIFQKEAYHSGDVVTSLEPSVQLFLENTIKEIHTTWDARLTAGVIIDPKDGSIYALVVHPGFDLNNFQDVSDVSLFSNPLVESVYELGSIVKPLTMAIGLDAGAVTANTTYYDHGFIELDGSRISNYDNKGRGTVNMQEVLNQSLNTGASFVVDQVGNDRFAKYLHSFGIGEETGIDLPNEARGIVGNLTSPRDIEYATASFGQGIAVTPIAMIKALCALANGGTLITPHIAQKIQQESGITRKLAFSNDARVLKESTSEEITRMLVEVVDSALLDGNVSLENYSVAAKTGTAQIAKVGERGYYEDRHLHSFFGYFPAYNPRFLVFLYTVEPKEVRYASQTLTYPFRDIVDFLISYYDIPPDR